MNNEERMKQLEEHIENLHALFTTHTHASDGSVAFRYNPYATPPKEEKTIDETEILPQ